MMGWWNEKKAGMYLRAASMNCFHSSLASLIQPYLEKGMSIVELGCGLGILTHELSSRGFDITGYDIDDTALETAARLYPDDTFVKADCYKLSGVADTALCVFFGRIGIEDNYEKLMNTCRKRLIYTSSEHSDYTQTTYRETDGIASFLDSRRASFTVMKEHLHFDQYLKDEEELQIFIEENYTKRGRPFSRKVVTVPGVYPIKVVNDKAFGLFVIEKEEKT